MITYIGKCFYIIELQNHFFLQFYLSVQIGCTIEFYLCSVKLKFGDYGIT